MTRVFPHLERAPITEALLDIAIGPVPTLAFAAVESFGDAVVERFPDRRPLRHAQVNLSTVPPSADVSPIGLIMWNADKTRATQGRMNGFSVHHVGQYRDWQHLRDDAQNLWRTYVECVHPDSVIRCALRYINRIEVDPDGDVTRKLLTRPRTGHRLPAAEDYLMRVVMPFEEDRKAAITIASEPRPADRSTSRGVIVDIEAFATREFAVGEGAIWNEFDALRTIKNICFFDSLRKATWEAYR